MLSSKKTVCVSASALMPVSMSLRMSVHPVWLGLAVWVEINVVPLAFTGFCPAERLAQHTSSAVQTTKER